MKNSRLLGAVCACLTCVIPFSAHAGAVDGPGTWETTLQARDFDGDMNTIEGWYDTVLNITWLADANANGTITWNDAWAWAIALDFGPGIDAWRLPDMMDTGAPGCDFAYNGTDCGYNVQTTSGSPPYPATTVYSEMASLFYDTLGNIAEYDASGVFQPGGLTNTGPFDNFQNAIYWIGLGYALDPNRAWYFRVEDGRQNHLPKTYDEAYAMAVHDGDVGTAVVPVPAAVWLFGSGLLGLIGISKRKKSA